MLHTLHSKKKLLTFAVHRRSLSSTRENTTDGRLEFSATAKSAGSERNCLSREQACYAAQDSQTPQYDRRTSLEHEASHLVYRTPQNKNSHSGRMSWLVNCIVLLNLSVNIFCTLRLSVEWWKLKPKPRTFQSLSIAETQIFIVTYDLQIGLYTKIVHMNLFKQVCFSNE